MNLQKKSTVRPYWKIKEEKKNFFCDHRLKWKSSWWQKEQKILFYLIFIAFVQRAYFFEWKIFHCFSIDFSYSFHFFPFTISIKDHFLRHWVLDIEARSKKNSLKNHEEERKKCAILYAENEERRREKKVNEVFIEVEEERNNFLWNFIKKMRTGIGNLLERGVEAHSINSKLIIVVDIEGAFGWFREKLDSNWNFHYFHSIPIL